MFAEGEEERVLRAVQVVIDEGLARPMLIGRPDVIERRLLRFGLRMRPGPGLRSHQSAAGRALPRLLG